MSALRRHPMIAGAIGFFVLLVLMASTAIVSETEQGIVLRFGKPVRIVNRFEPGQPFGSAGAGLAFKIPFAEDWIWIDKRVHSVEMQKQQVVSTDQRRLEVDAFANYRVVDPERMYVVARNLEQVDAALAPLLGSQLRNELGKRTFASLLSPEREGAMDNIRSGLDRLARQYGVEIVDVRIKKAELPDGAPLQAAFDQMRTARQQEARSIRAEGAKRAAILMAEADANAAKIYANSFGRDADFYDFYRAMQSYRATFLGEGGGSTGQTSFVLSPSSDYLRQFGGR